MQWMTCGAVVTTLSFGCAAPGHPGDTRLVRGAVPPDKLSTPGDNMFDCDAPTGHSSTWSHAIADTGQLTGSAYFYGLRSSPAWLPWATVLLAPTGGQPKVGVVLSNPSRATNVLASSATDDHEHPRYEMLEALPLAGDVHFALRWSHDKLEARIDPDPTWHPIPMSFAPARASVGCSTAEVVFHDLTLSLPH